jgi:abortive infection bacteriophage resistance protein
MKPFSKPYLTVPEQLALLRSRGMGITDDVRATAALERIGYYRLSGYWYPLRASTSSQPREILDKFQLGAEFGQVINLYVFDKKLRFLTLDALERVEVALRTDIALLLGRHSSIAHRKSELLDGNFTKKLIPGKMHTRYAEWLARLDQTTERSREEFVQHFQRTYSSPLPIWMAIELWDFGMLSIFLSGMRRQDQQKIASKYGLPRPDLLTGWVRSLNFVRNVCAHHSRLWNRPLIDQPVLPRGSELPLLRHLLDDRLAQTRFYSAAAILCFLLRVINPGTTWASRLKDHLATIPKAPGVALGHMGFPDNWVALPLWQHLRNG